MTADLDGMGTPESTWQSWPELRRWPLLDLASVPATVIVVAPHPDDEVLGVGGLLALLARAGSFVHLIAVTDGEASHPASPTVTPAALADLRGVETTQALAALGVVNARIERLRLPDGGVSDREARACVTAAVAQALADGGQQGAAWCLAPWSGDSHPDHDAAGLAAVNGVVRASRAGSAARLLAYPVWMWHWAAPGDPRVPWSHAHRIALPADVHAAKTAAIQAFTSQIHPLSPAPADAAILPPHILARLNRREEVVFEVGLR